MSERHMTEGEMAEAQKLAEFTDNLWRGVEPITPRSKEELLIARALLSTSSAVRGMREAPVAWQYLLPNGRWSNMPGDWHPDEGMLAQHTYRPLYAGPPVQAALSLEGEDKQATRGDDAATAPTDRLQDKESSS